MSAHQNPLTLAVAAEMNAVGLAARLIDEQYFPTQFGNAIVDFVAEGLLLRFIRDRSIDELLLGSTKFPEKLHPFCDVEIAMGWKSVDQVVAMQKAASLGYVIRLVKEHVSELESALSERNDLFTQASRMRMGKKGYLPPVGSVH